MRRYVFALEEYDGFDRYWPTAPLIALVESEGETDVYGLDSQDCVPRFEIFLRRRHKASHRVRYVGDPAKPKPAFMRCRSDALVVIIQVAILAYLLFS